MDLLHEVLQAELERLFALEEIQALVRDYLGVAPNGISDERAGKATFVRRLLDWADKDGATPALADVVLSMKGTAVDPRLRQNRSRRPPEDLEVGARLGPYTIDRQIGAGGVSLVYKASGPGGPVALRVLRNDHAFDQVGLHRYLAAQRMIRDVSHPSLARPTDIGKTDGKVWVASEYIEGRTARSLVKDGPAPFSRIRGVATRVLEALGTLHAKGLAHGDVKVENVIVSEDGGDGRTFLVGAGADRLVGRGAGGMEEAGRLAGFGTPKAAAPEQVRGNPVDARTDIYAVGVMLYELLCGTPPFADKTAADVAVKHLTVEPEPPSVRNPRGNVSKRVDALVLRCLRKDPAARFQTVEALIGEIEVADREEREATERRKAVREATVEEAQDWADQFMADPANEEIYAELEATARGANAWDVVLQALSVASDDAAADRKKDLLFRTGRICEAELKDFDHAEAAYRSVLEIDPADEMAVVAIEDLNRSAGRFDRLIDLILERAARAQSDAPKREALLEAARVYERDLDDPGKALTVVLQLYKEAPSEEALLDRVGTLAAACGGWQDVLTELGEVIAGGRQEPALVARLCARLGTWCADHVGRPDFALRYHQQALTIDPRSEPALTGLAQIYRSTQQWSELVQVLERRGEIAAFPSQRRDIMTEVAAMYEERLGARDKAVEIYRTVFAEDPAHAPSAAALERLYARLERWADLAEILEKRVGAVADAKDRLETCLSIAEIREDRLEMVEGAAESYRAALEIDPACLPALKGLERIYARRDQWKDLLGVLERQIELAATARQKVALYERIGAIHEEEFMNDAAATAAFEKVLAMDADNSGALTALARLYRAGKRWSELVDVIDHQCALAPSDAAKIECLRAQASVMVHELELWGPALDVLGKVVDFAPDDRGAYRQVVTCARKVGDPGRAAAALKKLAGITTDGAEKAKVLVELGGLLDSDLQDHAAAVDTYRAALDADPSSTAAAAALRTAYAERGDHAATIEMLQREIAAADGDLARARLYAQMGRIYREELDDKDRSIGCFEKTLELDRTSVEAAEPLAELYREADRWEDAARIYEQFAASASALPAESAAELFLRQGQTAERLGNLERAGKAFARAKDLKPADAEIHRRLAVVELALGHHDEARSLFRELLLRFEADMTPADRVEANLGLATAARALRDFNAAIRHLDEALKLEPERGDAVEARVAVHEEMEQWPEVVADLRKLMEKASDEERFDLLVRVGDILRERIKDNEKAAKSYHAALEIQPDHRSVLHKLIAVYQATEQWARVVEAILRIADLLDDKKMLSKYYLTAARVNAEKLDRKDEAVTYYDLALDNDPEHLAVFEELARILSDAQRWSDLERAYRKMIGRMEKGGDALARASMWHTLAEICQHRLNHAADAIAAYENALRLDPENRPWMEMLARLYGDDLRYSDKATRLHRQLLDMNPYRGESYQLLTRIHVARERWDEAWCFSSALSSLGLAEDAEKRIYDQYRDDQPLQGAEPLSDEWWRRYVHHESLDEMITGIFATVQPAYLKRHARTLKALGLADSDRLDVEAKAERLTWVLSEAARTLGIEPPPLYVRDDRAGALTFIDTDPPAVLAGKTIREMAEHEMEDLKVVAFLVGRHLAYHRPGFFVRTTLQSGTALATWFLAAVRRIKTNFPIPPNMVQPVTDAVEVLWRNLDRPATDKLGDQVEAFLEAVGGGLDLKRWGQAVDLTTDRGGFIVCNDVDIASKTIKSSPSDAWMAPVKDRLRELLRYSVGEEYLNLRDKMGTRIVVDAEAGGAK